MFQLSLINNTVTRDIIHARDDGTHIENDLTQINVFVSEQGYCELGWGCLWANGLCGPS